MESGYIQLTLQDLNELNTVKQQEYGTLGVAKTDGKQFRYVKFGGTSTIQPGFLMVGPAAPANSTALTITATGTGNQVAGNLVAGSKTLVITNGGTAVTQDQFQYLEINVGGASSTASYSLKINGHTAAAATTGYVTVYLAEPLPASITTLVPGTDLVNLVLSKYNGVIASTTGNAPVGVTTTQVVNTATVTNYGWVQTSGHAIVKATTATIGLGIAQDQSGTAGYVIISAATTGSIGYAKASAVSNTASVELNII
jgi:hypothetical protein